MGVSSFDAVTEKPTFNNTPTTTSDFQAAANYAEKAGNQALANFAAISSIVDTYAGMSRLAQDTGIVWTFNGTIWLPGAGGYPAPTKTTVGQQTIASVGTYAALPTNPAAASLVLPLQALVAVTVTSGFGAGTIGTPVTSLFVSAVLSGALSLAASDDRAAAGEAPGRTSGSSYVEHLVVPAGTLTATLQAYTTVSAASIRNTSIELAVLRWA